MSGPSGGDAPAPSGRFWVTSDLHYGARAAGNAACAQLARWVVANAAPGDGVVLGGDLAEGPEPLDEVLALFAPVRGPRLAVPGNHDVWLRRWEGVDDSWALHERHLPEAFARHGVHPLHLEPWRCGSLAWVGSMGWYDYSFRDDIGVPLEAYAAKTPPWSAHPIWSDARFARFDDDDPALTRRLNQRLKAHLASLDAEVETVLAMVHHCVTKRLLVHPRAMVPKLWRFANTFLGAECLGLALAHDARVAHVVCGHIHMGRTATVGARKVPCRSLASTYVVKQCALVTPEGVERLITFDADGVTEDIALPV